MDTDSRADFPLTLIDRSSGLPSNQIHRLAQDGLGRIWMAGPSGLMCYEGSRVRSIDGRHGLRCAGLRAVAVGPDDRVWIGTDQGVEAVDRDGVVVSALASLPWSIGLVGCIVAGDSETWLGTSQGLVQIVFDGPPGAQSRTFRLGARFDIGYVRDLVRVDANCLIAVSARLGLFMVKNSAHVDSWQPELPDPVSIRRLCVLGEGRLLVGSTSGPSLLDADGRLLACSEAAGGPVELGALAASAGPLWSGSGQHLIEYAEVAGRLIETSRRAVGSPINDLLLDSLGNLWIGTDTAGLARLSCLREAMQRVEVGSGAAVYVVKALADGDLLVAGAGFEARLGVDEQGCATPRRSATLPTTVWDVVLDHANGGRWLATHAGLYRAAAEAVPLPFDAGNPLLSAPCRVVILRGNEVWLGTLSGLLKLVDGVAHEVLGSDGLSLGYVYAMHMDNAGRLWVGTLGRGLWREGSRGLEPLVDGALSGTANNYVVAVSPDPQRALVVQNERIILLDRQGSARVLAQLHPVAGWTAVWLDAHRVAIGSSDGLVLFDTRSGELHSRINAIWSASDWEFTNNRALARGGDGRLYCGLNGGLVAVDLNAIERFRKPPVVALSQIVWHHAQPASADGWLLVDPGKWSLQVWVYCAWMIDEAQVSFRFRLAGFESEWSALQSSPVAGYSSLPPGSYLLQVQPHSPLTGYGEAKTLVQLRVRHRPVAALFAGLAAVYEGSVGLALRNRRLLARHAELEAEVGARQRVEQELMQHRAGLEKQVETRTRELVVAYDEAKRANRAKSEFLSRMSHELRTPLNAILGFAQLMELDQALDRRHRPFVDETLKAGHHLLDLINEVLDLAQIEAGRLTLHPVPIELDVLILDCAQMVEPAAQRRHIVIHRPDPRHLHVVADRMRLQQVLLNLLSNAVKYNREGGKVCIELSTPDQQRIRISVSDSGPGIASDRQAELFKPFNRLGAEFSTVEGTGIGLAISQQLMQMMGGTLGVQSQVGLGSLFWLEWPGGGTRGYAPSSDTGATKPSAPSTPSTPSTRPNAPSSAAATVLYVEDNAANRLLVSQIVERHAHLKLLLAATAAEGLESARSCGPGLLLLDLQLPDMDGYALLRQLRRDLVRQRTPAVAVTAYALLEDCDRSLSEGFAEHIVKPIDIAAFDAMLERHLPAPKA